MNYNLIEDKKIILDNTKLIQNDYGYKIGFKISKNEIDLENKTYNGQVNIVTNGKIVHDALLKDKEADDNFYYLYWQISPEATKKFGKVFISISIMGYEGVGEEKRQTSLYNTEIVPIEIINSIEIGTIEEITPKEEEKILALISSWNDKLAALEWQHME